MDSLSQIVLGASLAAAIAPAQNRRAALLAGAALGTLPDLDVFPLQLLTDNPVTLMTLHRGASHSLFVLPLVGWLIWWLCKRSGKRVAASPTRWFWAIQTALITHPILDAFTVYGTQLFWPLTPHPVMWSSLFIIDPLYTVWLLAGCLIALACGRSRVSQVALVAGLALSTAYIGWSLAAKSMADNAARQTLAQMGLANPHFFSVPTPLNTLLWRVVAMDAQGGFFEGEYSLRHPAEPIRFVRYPSATAELEQVCDFDQVRRLQWFNRGFMKAQIVHAADGNRDLLVLSDIRMGQEPAYFFNFAVAERINDDPATGNTQAPGNNASATGNTQASRNATAADVTDATEVTVADATASHAPGGAVAGIQQAINVQDKNTRPAGNWQAIAPFRLVPPARQWLDIGQVWRRIHQKPTPAG